MAGGMEWHVFPALNFRISEPNKTCCKNRYAEFQEFREFSCKRSAAKGVRSLFFVFGTLSVTFSVTFSDAFVTFSVIFLPNSFCRTPFAAG